MVSRSLAKVRRLLALRWQAISSDSRRFFYRLQLPLLLLVLVVVIGTVGYHYLWRDEAGSWSDALFMTMITITTIGYGEVQPLREGDRLFTMVIAITGIGALSYIFGSSMEFLVAQQLEGKRRSRRMTRMIHALAEHVIVAGYGRMGRWVAEELSAQKEPFVIIELGNRAEELQENDYLHIFGDASEDEVLQEAGIDRARCLIAVTSDDATNAFVVMSARALNPSLQIIARSENERSNSKLRRAGADSVINPYALGGQRLVRQVLYPAVLEFIEHATQWGDDLTIEEFIIQQGNPLCDHSLRALDLRKHYGVNVIALLRNDDGKVSTHDSPLIIPNGEEVIRAGDMLIVIGKQQDVERFDAAIDV